MDPWAWVAALAAALLAASAAHYLFWTWMLRVPGTEDEILRTVAADGWSLALARRRPRGPPRELPVLLLHGLAVNRLFMDFGDRTHSLSAHLAAAGFDCFALDLRGHGDSRRDGGRGWSFDDYVRLDLPAALDAVRAATGAPRALLAGHSQGALLALAGAGLYPDRVAALVAMAGPTHVSLKRELRLLARAAVRFRRFVRLGARMVAPFAGLLHRGPAQASINTRNVERPVLRRVMANAIENVSAGVALQFRLWIRQECFRSLDGAVDYRANLSRSRQPALFVAAPADGLAQPEVVRAGYEAWGGPREWLLASRADGFSADYGHGDLLFGRRAPEEIYPRLSEWLARQAALAARPGREPARGGAQQRQPV
jgi:pimeloyl-ACP methyl ester carboxylesterase